MTRPRLLDLFCGAGGCSVGYHRAGFDVVGVDLRIAAKRLEQLSLFAEPTTEGSK